MLNVSQHSSIVIEDWTAYRKWRHHVMMTTGRHSTWDPSVRTRMSKAWPTARKTAVNIPIVWPSPNSPMPIHLPRGRANVWENLPHFCRTAPDVTPMLPAAQLCAAFTVSSLLYYDYNNNQIKLNLTCRELSQFYSPTYASRLAPAWKAIDYFIIQVLNVGKARPYVFLIITD